MKRVVVYSSKTGFTKRYAQWIAQEIGCKALPLKEMKQWDMYDMVIFGGRVTAGKIADLDKIKKKPDLAAKKLIVYAVGACFADDEANFNKLRQENLSDMRREIPFFYFQGGICYEKLGFLSKKLLHMVGDSLGKKPNPTEEDIKMMKVFGASCDYTKREAVIPLAEMALKM